ncbi:golgin subfamily A member 6-like protein 7 [Selaginella moellendorffii]|uniref:golgin subfamily A member 6-like protein 7 n=1 Tax=Selaginella moellendorffii TaxID=88036 RepID=UPI000D1C9AD4|nr:golgin subfamily A member 6-like protein 7 [Selaginella moellendorffii]|eukprot:XP_024542347.1 golgin subfamily A member 6-like protein 7 [Selaginella moellendorffii]
MDEELAKVQAQIGRLEPQIQAAGESFLSAFESGNQSLVKYWQKKEEQLRKKEEQLRKEKEQLRKKELLLLQCNAPAPAPAAGLPPADSYVPDMIAWAKKLDENLTADFADGGIDWTSHATFR